ncbi:putative rmlC-like cupin domain superfamily, rmlC-like jelly roll protein [Helianthus anomalus]
MANPRRTSTPITPELPIQFQPRTLDSRFSRLKLFLKKPQAFPFLLSIFLILTWVFLRIHQQTPKLTNPTFSTTNNQDHEANLIRFSSRFPSPITKDPRGWILDPVSIALDSGISGGALTCASIHVGEIKPGGLRGNHRHYTCNETFLIWGATTVFRVENHGLEKGYAQVTLEADDVAIAVSPKGTAHALVNVDSSRTTYIVGCQDRVISYNSSNSDFRVWDDLNS